MVAEQQQMLLKNSNFKVQYFVVPPSPTMYVGESHSGYKDIPFSNSICCEIAKKTFIPQTHYCLTPTMDIVNKHCISKYMPYIHIIINFSCGGVPHICGRAVGSPTMHFESPTTKW